MRSDKGKKVSEEIRLKLYKSNYWRGKKRSLETRIKMGLSKIGVHPSRETRLKMSLAKKGKNAGEENYQWKGDKANYRTKHAWITRKNGLAKQCSKCGKLQKKFGRKNVHWANIDHTYKRIIEDWIALCTKCHGEYDKIKGLRLKNRKLKIN